MDTIRKVMAAIGLARQVHNADGGEELQAAKRFGKGLLVGIAAVLLDSLAKQSGAGCGLGPTACAVLSNPLVTPTIAAGLLAIEKYLNERFGFGIQVLDTTVKPPAPAPEQK